MNKCTPEEIAALTRYDYTSESTVLKTLVASPGQWHRIHLHEVQAECDNDSLSTIDAWDHLCAGSNDIGAVVVLRELPNQPGDFFACAMVVNQ